MRRVLTIGIACLLLVTTSLLVQAADRLSAAQASGHLGETATVCGEVASTKYASSSRGQPTFLNLGRPYPNHIFTAVIWDESRSKFRQSPEIAFDGKYICVRGVISSYRSKPQIEVTDPSQIVIE